jgi:hypothetical protein
MFYGLLDLHIVQYAAAGLLFSNTRQSHTNIDWKDQPALPPANPANVAPRAVTPTPTPFNQRRP